MELFEHVGSQKVPFFCCFKCPPPTPTSLVTLEDPRPWWNQAIDSVWGGLFYSPASVLSPSCFCTFAMILAYPVSPGLSSWRGPQIQRRKEECVFRLPVWFIYRAADLTSSWMRWCVPRFFSECTGWQMCFNSEFCIIQKFHLSQHLKGLFINSIIWRNLATVQGIKEKI